MQRNHAWDLGLGRGLGGTIMLILCLTGSVASAQTVQYSELAKGGKLPYGKNVTLVGKLSDLKCDNVLLTSLLDITAISASYLGQTTPAANGALSADSWSLPLGSLPADTAINLTLKVTGKITTAKQTAIVDQLMSGDSFQRRLGAFVMVTKDQVPAVVTQEVEQLLRDISSPEGALTSILESQLPCVSVAGWTDTAVTALRASPNNFINLSSLLRNVTDPGLQLQGVSPGMLPGDLHKLIVSKAPPKSADTELQGTANTAFARFEDAYKEVSGMFQADVVAELSVGVRMDVNSVTSDFAKYAGFDVGAIYIPRIDELRQFFMVNIYPSGPVDLDNNGVPIGGKARFSIALGLSVGDLSSNANSRIKGDNAFIYGIGYRVNKYFRITVGGALYRDAGAGKGLLHEAFIAPSIDLTALPGLKQIFASANGKASSNAPGDQQNTNAPSGAQQAKQSNPPSGQETKK
jgi:hypothetical protein